MKYKDPWEKRVKQGGTSNCLSLLPLGDFVLYIHPKNFTWIFIVTSLVIATKWKQCKFQSTVEHEQIVLHKWNTT